MSPGAPEDEMLLLFGLDEHERIALQMFFDIDDTDAAMAELNAAHARLEARPPRAPLENAATQADNRLNTLFTDRRWDEIGKLFADNIRLEDRRRGLRNESNDRATAVAAVRAIADSGTKSLTPDVLAIRGKRLALVHTVHQGRDTRPDAFHTETLTITEVNADGLLVATVAFDPGDIGAAFEELDARYLAGEAAPYARVWQSVMDTLGEANRHEPGPIISGLTYVDHRRVSFGSQDFRRAVEELWALVPDARYRVTAVHALDAHGTVASLVIQGTDSHGNELQWPRVVSLVPDEPRMEVYEEDDVNAALARFEELRPRARLENAASRMYDRFNAYLAARNWDAMADMVADDVCTDDRRRVVSGGIQRGRDAQTANLRAVVDVGVKDIKSVVIATRGERLALTRSRVSGGDQPEAFALEMLNIVEIDTDNRIAAGVLFDLDDFDAAIKELDARYLAGEAAAHADMWSVITQAHAAFKRHELPTTTPDWVNLDHRRGAAFAPGEAIAYVRAGWDLDQVITTHIEEVHRLNELGAVFTWAGHGTSQEGFDAEWRGVSILTVEGGLISRTELFDEADLDAALARFEELRPPARLENAASRVAERFLERFAARDWDAIAEILADDFFGEDRRPVVGAGIRHGRDLEIASIRAGADLGGTNLTSTVIATRGARLILTRTRHSGRDQAPGAFRVDVLGVVEIDADERIMTRIVFDPEDIDAAFEELDARYLAGEAAAHAHTFSVIANAYNAFNRREIPATTPDWVNIDHRRATPFASGDLVAFFSAAWEDTPDLLIHIETVHRVSDLGAVFTWTGHGISHEGFEADWRGVELMTVEDDLISRAEIFDEADLDDALARFEELHSQHRRLENTASRLTERYWTYFAERDWDGIGEMVADDIWAEDRRRVVNAGIRQGRDAEIADMRAIADTGTTNAALTVIATRGDRLALIRFLLGGRDQRPEAFRSEMLGIAEINAENRLAARILFDVDDIDAAFEELDARYLAGEGAAHAQTWSIIARAFASVNRRELPEFTPDWVNIDHRRAIAFAPGEMTAYVHATWDATPDSTIYIEAVHRLSNFGAIVTQVGHEVSQHGFEAEWRMINLLTVKGELLNRTELFDEADLDAALARFEELGRPPRLENAASQVYDRFWAYFAARDWAALAEMLAEDIFDDDRRRVVNAGTLRGRDEVIADVSALADIGAKNVASEVIATRGARLVLRRARYSGSDERPEAFHVDALDIVEIDADERLATHVSFDLHDIDAAFAELDARYLAGEAAAHAHTWSAIAGAFVANNRREVPAATTDVVSIDHRRVAAFAPGEGIEYIRAGWDLNQNLNVYIEAVHRVSDLGAVFTWTGHGTSHEGFEPEWRGVELMTAEGGLISRAELFDEADLHAALAKLDELTRPARRLENAASRADDRLFAYWASGDWDALAGALADDSFVDDRRHVVNIGLWDGRDVVIANLRALAVYGASMTLTVIATRGERLALTRICSPNRDLPHGEFAVEMLGIAEIDAGGRIAAHVMFDPDDIDAAYEELDARYLAGEAAACSHTWSAVKGAYASFNRRELPATTPDWLNIDHRRGAAFAPGDVIPYIRSAWDVAPDIRIYIAAVHRLSPLGAVVTYAANGTSREGFDAKWREITLLTFEGDLISRCEIFDEADLDAATGRFDELTSMP
jgi:hypothetical protein